MTKSLFKKSGNGEWLLLRQERWNSVRQPLLEEQPLPTGLLAPPDPKPILLGPRCRASHPHRPHLWGPAIQPRSTHHPPHEEPGCSPPKAVAPLQRVRRCLCPAATCSRDAAPSTATLHAAEIFATCIFNRIFPRQVDAYTHTEVIMLNNQRTGH